MTSGIQDIITLNRELPQITSEDPKDLSANIENRFDAEDKQIMDKLGLIQPSALTQTNVDDRTKYQTVVKETMKQNVHAQVDLKNRKNKDGVAEALEEKRRERNTIEAYLQTIGDLITLKTYYLKPKTGSGGRYKQPKRNAYKIQDGNYGGLITDLPKLLNEMKLNAYRGGKLVYQSGADKSLINLLTKRFNPKTKYSMNAVRIFNDFNSLSNMPKHRSSGKSRMVGSSVTYYNNANELADRMKILVDQWLPEIIPPS